jgi:hypothetical protein
MNLPQKQSKVNEKMVLLGESGAILNGKNARFCYILQVKSP